MEYPFITSNSDTCHIVPLFTGIPERSTSCKVVLLWNLRRLLWFSNFHHETSRCSLQKCTFAVFIRNILLIHIKKWLLRKFTSYFIPFTNTLFKQNTLIMIWYVVLGETILLLVATKDDYRWAISVLVVHFLFIIVS